MNNASRRRVMYGTTKRLKEKEREQPNKGISQTMESQREAVKNATFFLLKK